MKTLNTQPRSRRLHNPHAIRIHSIWRTIQGEGPWTGLPATFIRTFGCNLCCPMCDTIYSGKSHLRDDGYISTKELVDKIMRSLPSCEKNGIEGVDRVVITGGEPFIQFPSLIRLVKLLMMRKVHVQIETNASIDLWADHYERDGSFDVLDSLLDEIGKGSRMEAALQRFTIVASPKTGSLPNGWHSLVDFWKYVIKHNEVSPDDGLPISCLGGTFAPARPPNYITPDRIFVQPLDEHDPDTIGPNQRECVRSAIRFGYRLNVQLHKVFNLR